MTLNPNDRRRLSSAGRAAAAFLRLWFVLFFAFAVAKLLFNLVVLGWIDLRPAAFLELLLLPLAQSIVFWAITRRRRAPRDGSVASE